MANFFRLAIQLLDILLEMLTLDIYDCFQERIVARDEKSQVAAIVNDPFLADSILYNWINPADTTTVCGGFSDVDDCCDFILGCWGR